MVARINLDAWVDHGEDLEPLFVQPGDHQARLGKALSIPGKAAIVVHIMDIQVDHVTRELAAAKLLCHFQHALLRIVAPARLVEAKRPQRRKGHAPGDLGVGGQDFGRRADHDVQPEFPINRPIFHNTRLVGPHIQERTMGVVEEQTDGGAVV